MELQDGCFSESMIETCSIGAGIIPIAIDDHGQVQILLAKERYVQQWKGSFRWSGFEGSKKENEDLHENAIRELDEESLGIITFDKPIKELLEEKKYVMRIVINIFQDRPNNRYHSTYLVKVKWNTEWVQEFRILRNKLLRLKALGDELCNAKYNLKDIYIGALFTDKNISGVIKAIKNVEIFEQGKIMITLELETKNNDILRCVKYTNVTKYCSSLLYWFKKRLEIQNLLFDHNALDITYDKYGLVLSLNVKDDYLEKERIQWWSLEELKSVIQYKGQYLSEFFRPYFMPVLQTIVQECSKYSQESETLVDSSDLTCKLCELSDAENYVQDDKMKNYNIDKCVERISTMSLNTDSVDTQC